MTPATPDLAATASTGLLCVLPAGARLDEAAFASRHRLLWGLLLLHLPVLAGVGLLRGVGGPLL